MLLMLLESQKSLFVKLRFGIPPLVIETGRYYGKPFAQRSCKMSQSNVIVDEVLSVASVIYILKNVAVYLRNRKS